ncbi:uncharacterized protein [Lepeophtheirus salmonis]
MELAMLKKKGVSSTSIWSPDPSRACGRCRSELGRIMNRGAYCKSCRVKVCKNCREYGVKGTEWICNVCHKNIEIKVASGEWVNEYLNKIPPKKKHSKLILPGSSLLEGATKKKNIRRSWTISNPSGTLGPQIPVRRVNSGDPELKSYAKVDVSIIHDDLTPKVAPPPVFMSVPQAPIHYRGARSLRGNVPIRSQSMSQADSDRFFANGARVMSRHRNDQYRRPSQSYEESSSENDEGPPWANGSRNHKYMNKKYIYASNTSSLDRRKQRRTTSTARPHPSHSLPRPPKRVSEHEDRRTVREPTPDYDDSVISSEAKESLRMKSDSGVDESTSSSTTKTNNSGKNYYGSSEGRRHSLTEKKYFKLEEEEHDRKSSRIEDITLSDLESTRVDDYGSLAGDPEDDDILICSDKKKPPEGNDFKLVFISSCDSSKESEINPTDQQPYRKSKKQKDSAPEIPPKRNKLIRSIRDDSLLSDSERIALSSPSVSTIRTSNATKDPASPLNGSPGRVPKVHHIPIILKKDDTDETSSQDAEVRSILRDSRYFQTIKQKEFLRVSLLADVTSIVPTSPNRSLSESDLSEVQDYLLGSSPYLPIAWNEEEEEKKETGRISGTGGPPLPPKTRRQREPKSSSLLETFVDEQTRPSKRLARSYSNVGSDLNRLRPVRRSKSYKGSKSVTNIRFEDSDIQGSHTLPKKKHAPHEQEENKEDVIITRQGANFVRIQIGPRLSATPDLHHTSVERKYSLEELEVEEGFPSNQNRTSNRELDNDSDITSSSDRKSRRRGSIALIKTSDTEGDFLDKDPNNNHHHNRKVVNQKELLKRLDLKRKELSLLLNGSVESISKDSKSVVSDVDSVSTTSASYTIHHSDEDELDEKKSTRSVHSYNRRNEEEERMNLSMNKRPGKTSSIDDTCAPATPPASTTTSIPSSLSTSSVLNPDLPKHETAPKVSDLIAKFEQNKSVVVPSKSLSNISNKSNGHHLEEDEETRSLDKNFEGDYDDEDLPLGAEASSVSQSQRDTVSTAITSENGARESSASPPPMAPTVRRNSNGAYTSYVFISSNPNEDSVASAPSDRVTVHSGGSCVMTVQDGRSSNISIVSTESSDLGSPTNESEVEPNYDSPPDVPSKTTLRPTVQDIPDLQRSRGGEPLNVPSVGDADDLDSFDPNVQDGGEGLANYFTNSLEASSAPSRRRMRPSVIRSARRVENDIIENNCDQEDEESTHQDESRHHQASEEEEEEASFGEEELYSDDYDVDYDDQENFMDYPMCQPVYDDSDYSESDLLSSGDEDFGGEREEELRGYNRAIDFTLHTIIEESCEDSESDCNSTSHHHSHYPPKRQSDPSELEKYFYYGVGGGEDHHDSCESSFSEEETNHRIIENVSDGSGSDCFSNNSRSKKSISQKAIEERENSSGATEEEDDMSNHSLIYSKSQEKRRSSAGDAVTNESLSSDKFPLPINPIVGRIEDQRTEVSSPPVNGPVRKHKSRDSGFVGSCDDLLRNDSSSLPHLNTDSAPSLPSDDGTTDGSIKYISSSPRFERLSEIHEQPREENEDIKVLSKDNWNSDDEPVLMMNKMKDFFRSMLPDNSHPSSSRVNPDEEAREETLSRLMKSVPSLEEEQVKEIVERLGDEKTWTASSDSYLNDEEEILFSKMNRMSTDRRISESAMRQLSSRLILLMKETDSSKKKWRRSWSMSSENDSSLPKLTLLPTEAKIRHTTNSLPRLGTSSIQKSRIPSEVPSTNGNSNGPISGPAKSARYRPPGAKPLPPRKISPSIITSSSSIGSIRKYSSESGILGRFLDDANNDLSSKSGTPSPVIGREIRESSVCSRSSVDTNDEGDVVSRDERFPSPFTKHGSLSNLGVRSESMASVYSQGEGRYGTVVVRGDVEFGIHYRNGALEIAVKQCKDLAAVDIKRNRSDPYVKVYLLPDKSKSGKRKTKVKKHTLNPVFDEILKYQIPLNEVEKRTMWLTVWHSDMFGRNDFLGEVMQPLSGVDLVDTMTRWYNLQDRTEPLSPDDLLPSTTYRGELIVALKFVPSSEIRGKVSKVKGHLQILIKEGKNLVPPKGSNNIDPFCKCYLLPGKGLKQKTTICRRTNKPKWEQTISWDDVTLAELSDRSLEITVWDHDRLGHNEMIGGLRFNNGSGKHQHRFVNWMDSSGKEVTLWQQMLERPNFWVEGSVHLRTAERMTNV